MVVVDEALAPGLAANAAAVMAMTLGATVPALVAETPAPDYLGLAFYGDGKQVRRLTGSLGLLR